MRLTADPEYSTPRSAESVANDARHASEAAGVTNKLMELVDIVRIVDAYERGEEVQTERKSGGKSNVGPISKSAHTYD